MNYSVFFISQAKIDISEIYHYVAKYDSVQNAKYLLTSLKETCISLAHLPNRGHCPPELERINVLNYQEIHYKSYRIIYQVINKIVYIHCVLDGRRDLQDLLYERLIR